MQSLEFPSSHDDFKELLAEKQIGTVGETTQDHETDLITPRPPIKRIALDHEDSVDLKLMYKGIYPNENIDCLRLCDSFARLSMRSTLYQSFNNVGVIAKWFNGEVRPGRICRFLNHDIIMKGHNGKKKKVSNFLAEVEWFRKHTEVNVYPTPFEVWSTEKEGYSELSYIPVKQFLRKCIIVNYKVKFTYGSERVNVVIPMIGHQ
jgi:hypothetical protein